MGISLIVQAVIFVASTAYQIQQQKKAKKRAAAAADARKGFEITVSGEAAPMPIVYGKNVLGGIEVKHNVTSSFTSATDTSTKTFTEGMSNSSVGGSKNEFLHVQYALCTEGIEGVQWVRINGQHYNESSQKFKHLIRTFANGGTADPIATSNGISSTNRFTKSAFASATYRLNRDDANYQGVPAAEFMVKGRKVRSVINNSGTYSLSSTYAYSNNPALCLLDYLTNADGRGLNSSYIDLESFYHSAQVCDTVVATNRSIGGKINGQKTLHTVADEAARPVNLEDRTYENEIWFATAEGTYWQWNRTAWVSTTQSATRPIPLYECNIAVSTADQVRDNIEKIMATMGLAELTWSSEGKYKLNLEYPADLAATEALVDNAHIFTDDDIIRDQVEINWPAASDRLSQATVSFSNEHEDFKQDTVTWPPTNSSIHNTYLTEDNNQPFTASLSPEGITDPYHALAMAEQAVRKARTIYTVKLTVSKKGLNLEPGDFIRINSENIGILGDCFRVETIAVNADFTVQLTVYRFDQEVLAWNISDNIAYTTPPTFDFSIDAPTNLTFSNTGEILGTTAGNLSWTQANDSAVHDYLVEIKPTNVAFWTVAGTTRSDNLDLAGMTTGNYDISVRSRSPLGTMSDRLMLTNQSFTLVTVSKVKVIYANGADEVTNTQSDSPTNMSYVAYLTYDGDEPTIPVRSGLTFVQYVGADGAPGSDGADGTDGAPGAPGADGADGTDGAEAPRFAQITLYTNPAVTTAPSAPQATFVWSSGTVVNITSGWSTSPPSQVASSLNKVYNSILTFHAPTAPFTSTTAIGATPSEATNFTGLVTFNSGDFSLNGATITSIDGGNIAAGTLNVDNLYVGDFDQASDAQSQPSGTDQGFAVDPDGNFVAGNATNYMRWDSTDGVLTVAGEVSVLSEPHLSAKVGGPFHQEIAAGDVKQMIKDYYDPSNLGLDLSGPYIFVMTGGGGGGGAKRQLDADYFRGGHGGCGAGLAIFSFYWDGFTPMSWTKAAGGAAGQLAVNATGTALGSDGGSSVFTWNTTQIVTTTGGQGGKGDDTDSPFGTARTGGTASFTIPTGYTANDGTQPFFLSSLARTGGGGSTSRSGGHGCNFFDDVTTATAGLSLSAGPFGKTVAYTSDSTTLPEYTQYFSSLSTIMGVEPGVSFVTASAGFGGNTPSRSTNFIGGAGLIANTGNDGNNVQAWNGHTFAGGGHMQGTTAGNTYRGFAGNGGYGGGGGGVQTRGLTGNSLTIGGNGGGGILFWSKL